MARVPGPGSDEYNVLKTQPTQEQMHQGGSPERVRVVLRCPPFSQQKLSPPGQGAGGRELGRELAGAG